MSGAGRRYFGLDPEHADPERAAVAILPVPYDGTSTWKKGADRGPEAILEASTQVELYDIETDTEPYLHGIASLDPVTESSSPEAMADAVEARVAAIFERRQVPVVLGGEHSVSIGAFRAAAARFPNISVLQIDAHGDTREEYEGSSCNHACVMARARELGPIVQVGIRAVDASEVPELDRRRVFFAHQIARADSMWMDRVTHLLTDDVWVTIDLDAFDPSIVPATGTPEPGGLDWYQVTGLISRVARWHRIVGFDVVELMPRDGEHASDFLAAKLVYRVLAAMLSNR